MHFSKSDYLLFKQCPKALWLQKHQPHVFKQDDNQSRFEKGNEITLLARTLFPNGYEIPFSLDILNMVSQTKRLLDEGVTTIYEATFLYQNALVMCDILHLDEEGWKIYEVKSSTSVKERHLDDLAFQHYVVSQFLAIHSTYLVFIDKTYTRQEELSVRQLFHIEEKTKEILDKLANIPSELNEMNHICSQSSFSCEIGTHCDKYGKEPFSCAAKNHCWAHIPDYSVFNLTRIGKKAFDLYQKGIVLIEDIPDTYKLSESQRFQVNAHQQNQSIIDKESIKTFLSTFTYPLYFLDFETFQQTIPLYKGIRPYQQIPFQYSLHMLPSKNGDLTHKEFLGKEGTDPRRALAEQLVKDIPADVCCIAYNMSFEKMVLNELSAAFPDLAVHLHAIHDNMVDLMVPFQKKWMYTNAMKGSYSIKYVLPALFPNDQALDYKQLTIQNGSMAMETYERLHTYNDDDIQQIRQDLLAYCKLDTYAMVKVWEGLHQSL